MIDAWYLDKHAIGDAELAAARTLLADAERARHDRYLLERDRRDFAFAHALTRTTLSKYDAITPGAWTFGAADKGKPFITSPTTQPLSFNLSHTQGFVACVVASGIGGGISGGIDVGIDVEALDRKVEGDDIARRYFAGIEINGLHALSGDERVERFFELWTLKEAYTKAVGSGLSSPLDAMSFVFLDTDEIVFTPPPGVDACQWQFALFAPTPRHRMAIAARCADGAGRISARDAASGSAAAAVRVSVR